MNRRAAYILTVRSGMEDHYREVHRAVWPELIEEASRAGIHNHSVFMTGRTLFVYLEADDVTGALAKLLATPVKQRWDEFMRDFLEPESVTMKEVFHMD